MSKRIILAIAALFALALLLAGAAQLIAFRHAAQAARAAAEDQAQRAATLDKELAARAAELATLQSQLDARAGELAALQARITELETRHQKDLAAAPLEIPIPGFQIPLPNLDPDGDLGAFLEGFDPALKAAVDDALNKAAPRGNVLVQGANPGDIKVMVNGVEVNAQGAAGQQPGQPGAAVERKIEFPGGKITIHVIGGEAQPKPPPPPPDKEPGNF